MRALLFDIGGTTTRVSVSKNGKTFPPPLVFPTPHSFDAGVNKLQQAAVELASGQPITIISGGLAGPLSKNKDRFAASPNLPAWIGHPIKKVLENTFRCPVILENDAAIEALGEATHGAGRNHDIVAYLAVGTGVGGARIVRGKIDNSTYGFEPGHQVIAFNRLIKTPSTIISGKTVLKRTKKPAEVVKNAKLWHELSVVLGVTLVNITVMWSPEIIVLGGSVMLRLDIPTAVKTMRRDVDVKIRLPKVVRGTLGQSAGLYGALALIRQKSR